MKKLTIFLLLIVPFIITAHNYTSSGSGGPWGAPATWGGAGVPRAGDTATIVASTTVTVGSPGDSVDNVTIAGGTLIISATTLTVYGNFFNSGTFSMTGIGAVVIFSGSNQIIGGAPSSTFSNLTISPSVMVTLAEPITVSGTLNISSGTFNCAQYTVTGGGSMSMASGTTMLLGSPGVPIGTPFPTGYSASNISLSSTSTVIYQAQTIVTQTVSTTPTYQNLAILSNCVPAAYPNTLFVKGNFINNGTFTATAGGVEFNGSAAQTLGGSRPSTFYDLTISPSPATVTVTLGNNEVVSHNLTISSGTLDVSASNYRLTIGNNFTNNATFNAESGTVTMDGNADQTISASSGGLTFYSLRDSQVSQTDQMILANAITVTDLAVTEGTLNCQTYQITGNASGFMTMANGASLLLGSPLYSTPVAFPRYFTTSNTTLNSNSTVTYQADNTQDVSDTPTYGNLILSSTSAPAGSPLTVAGNLTNNTTLSGGVTSGVLNVGGNLTNNGTFAPGTGSLVNFYGSSGTQIIGGTAPNSSFYNFRTSGGAVVDLGAATTVSNNLSLAGTGGLDATSANNWNLTVGGNFTDSSAAMFYHRSNTVTMNGTILGGPTVLDLNKLIIAGSTTLAGNINTTSDITINGSATFDASSYNVNIAGNFTDNGTFNCSTSTVDFDNNGKQCVSGVHTSETFKNLTVGPLSKLGTSCTVDIDGTIFIQPGGQMLCACH